MENIFCPAADYGSMQALDSELLVGNTRRKFLKAAGLLMAGLMLPEARSDQGAHAPV